MEPSKEKWNIGDIILCTNTHKVLGKVKTMSSLKASM